MNIKSIAFSGLAVIAAVVMSLGLIVQSAEAATTVAAGAKTVSIATNTATGTGACTLLSSVVLTEAAAGDTTTGQTFVLTTPAGWSWCAYGSVAVAAASGAAPLTTAPTVAVAATSATIATATTTGVSAGGAAKFTWSGLGIRPDTAASASGSVALTGTGATAQANAIVITAGGSATAAYSFQYLRLLAPGATCDATYAALYTAQPQIVPSDGSAGWVICGLILDDVGNPAGGAGVTFATSTGIVSTGTAKTVMAVSNSTGFVTTTYRGQGNAASTDTVVASYSLKNAVATQSVTLAAPAGGTASKIVASAPANLAYAPTITGTTANYFSSQTGSDLTLRTVDASGLGVNGQVLLVTVDRGYVIADAAYGAFANTTLACAAANAKSITVTTGAANKDSRTGSTGSGYADVVICGYSSDAPGKVTATVSNVSTTMANTTVTATMAGTPAKVAATATGNTINATVTDAGGNLVADGTPVRFTISANAGAVSTACTTTVNGVASSVVALIASTGTVIVSTDWNESVAAATCAAAGAKSAAVSVTVPGGTASSAPTTAPSSATISSGSVPAAGGFGLIVAGGPLSGLAGAACPSSPATAAFWATVNGDFVTYVPGTSIAAVNAAFNTAFPNGIPSGTPLTAKCK